jgi:hypothetical protein
LEAEESAAGFGDADGRSLVFGLTDCENRLFGWFTAKFESVAFFWSISLSKLSILSEIEEYDVVGPLYDCAGRCRDRESGFAPTLTGPVSTFALPVTPSTRAFA